MRGYNFNELFFIATGHNNFPTQPSLIQIINKIKNVIPEILTFETSGLKCNSGRDRCGLTYFGSALYYDYPLLDRTLQRRKRIRTYVLKRGHELKVTTFRSDYTYTVFDYKNNVDKFRRSTC